jgi:hypothetical protein
VQLGEPIVVDIVLRGDGALDSASLPRLDAPGLLPVDRFRVPDDMPTGVVQEDGSKHFRVTVRVLDEQVDALPALEYSWFDPNAGTFATTHSRPIALAVKPGRTIGADDVVSVAPEPEIAAEAANPPTGAAEATLDHGDRVRGFDAGSVDLSIERDIGVLTTTGSGTSNVAALASLYAVGLGLAGLGAWAGRRARLDPRVVGLHKSLDAEMDRVRAVASASETSARESARELADALRRMRALVPDAHVPDLDVLLGELDAVVFAPSVVVPGLGAATMSRAVAVAEALVAAGTGSTLGRTS